MSVLSQTLDLYRSADITVQVAVVLVVAGITWQPIRQMLHQWRLHRLQQRYPQMVIMGRDNGGGGMISMVGLIRPFRYLLFWFIFELIPLVLSFLAFTLREFFAFAVWLVPDFSSARRKQAYINNRPAQAAETFSPPSNCMEESYDDASPAAYRQPLHTPPPSALRKNKSAVSQSRVEFAKQSDGNIRTEHRYYHPHIQPNRSIQKPPRPSTSSPSSPITQSRRARPTPPRRHLQEQLVQAATSASDLPPAYSPNSGMARTPANTPARQESPMASYLVTLPASSTASTRNLPLVVVPTSLSESMRKRRRGDRGDTEEDSSSPLYNKKRPNLSSVTGRVRLVGGLRPRSVIQNKREREDRILKDLNTTKKPKKEEAAILKKKEGENQQPIPNFGGSSNNDASKPAASSGFSFGGGGGGQPALAPAVPSFGGGSASSAIDASKSVTPAFTFGSSDGKSTAPASTSAASDKPSTTVPSFGAKDPSATPAPAGGTPSAGSFSFNANTSAPLPAEKSAPTSVPTFGTPAAASAAPTFGSTAAANTAPAPAAPTFGATSSATPAPAPTFGGPAAPAPSATGGFSFGASSTIPPQSSSGQPPAPTFGASNTSTSSAAPTFGGSSAPAPAVATFGGAAPAPTAPAFGGSAPAATPAFGGSAPPTPAFGASTPAFGGSAPTAPAFGAPTPPAAPGGFGSGPPAGGGFSVGAASGASGGASSRRRAKRGGRRR